MHTLPCAHCRRPAAAAAVGGGYGGGRGPGGGWGGGGGMGNGGGNGRKAVLRNKHEDLADPDFRRHRWGWPGGWAGFVLKSCSSWQGEGWTGG